MNKITAIISIGLLMGVVLSAGLYYINQEEVKNEENFEYWGPDPGTGDGTLGEDILKRWQQYSQENEFTEIITLDPGIARVSPGEELVKNAQLEGMNNFTNSGQGTEGSNDSGGLREEKDASYSGDDDAPEAAGDDGGNSREVEEADLVKVIGNTLYVLNSYRGLVAIDISEPENAKIMGQCPVIGDPVEMYVVDFLAIITVRTNYNFWMKYWGLNSGNEDNTQGTVGTLIYIVNVNDPSDPTILKIVELEGYAGESRRVGHVIYQATNVYSWYGNYDEGQTIVTSIDLSDPDTVGMKDQIRFGGNSNQVHASSKTFYVTRTAYHYNEPVGWNGKEEEEWDEDDGEGKQNDVERTRGETDSLWDYPFHDNYEYYTDITYLDISAPDGDMVERDTFRIPGTIQDKYQMDEYRNTFRMVSHFWKGIGESRLYIVDISDPDTITPLGDLLIDDAGSLMATRFAGERAYTIHLPRAIDPLDVLDLRDPTQPKLCDVFEMPGWVTHMEVRGMNIIALGVDDSQGQRNIAVSLFDVTDPYKAVMLERVRLGGDHAYSSANWEPKALTIDDTHNIVVVPFQSYSQKDWKSIAGVQIVKFDLDKGDLELRGSVSGKYSIERTRVVGEHILATSFKSLQVIDISDLASPTTQRTLDLCVNIKDIVPLEGMFIQMTMDWYDDSVVLRCVKNANDLGAESTHFVETDWARFLEISGTPILAVNVFEDGNGTGSIYTMELDEQNNIVLKLLSQLPNGVRFQDNTHNYGWNGYYEDGVMLEEDTDMGRSRYSSRSIYFPGSSAQRFLTLDNALVYYHIGEGHHPYSNYEWDPEYNLYLPRPEVRAQDKLFVFDLSDSTNVPIPTSTTLDSYSFSGMVEGNGRVYIHHQMNGVIIVNNSKYDHYDDEWYEYYYYEWYHKSYASEIELGDLSSPHLLGEYNIPGKLVGAGIDVLYTISQWNNENATLNILSLHNNTANITSALDIGNSNVDVKIVGEKGYITETSGYNYYYYDRYYMEDGEGNDKDTPKTSLRILDLSLAQTPVLVESMELEGRMELRIVNEHHLVFYHYEESSLLVYSTTSLPALEFEKMVLLRSLNEVWIGQGHLLVSQGYYGALAVELDGYNL